MSSIEKKEIDTIFQQYPENQSSLIMVLQDVQARYNYLPQEAIQIVSEHFGVPRSQIYSIVSFYKCFSLEPRGIHKVDVCTGTACHVRGADKLIRQLSDELGINPGQTTADKSITLNTVHCVGACSMGPVVAVDGEYYGEMTPVKLSATIKKCCSGKDECVCDTSTEAAVVQQDQKPGKVEKLESFSALEKLRREIVQESPLDTECILVCAGTGCVANGSLKVAEALKEELAARSASVNVTLGIKKTGCHGLCEKGPLVVFHPQGTFYTRVKPEDVKEIVEKTILDNKLVDRLLYHETDKKETIEDYTSIPFYALQQRNVLRNVGKIDPQDIRDYIAHGGYASLAAVLSDNEPERVINEVERSGLRGRGGGGFLTGRKWRACINAPGDVRYIICNGDEGDPGAFMDCSIMEGDPHAVIEGMCIAAYAIQSTQGFIYVREEYPRALERLRHAMDEARLYGLLGENILGTGFSFDIQINRGAGAFVCGESTALMQSIEGKVGEPRAKYIRSVVRGLYDKPTALNNVETFATIPLIIEKGADWFSAIGTAKSKGTKAFSVVGKVRNTGLVEVPMGTSLRSIIYDICGGILNDRPFKAVQTGGPSGGCLPESKLDLPVDFDTLTAEGSMMGSGGMIVMDDTTCMVDVARYFTEFLTEESCGKCAACRLGLESMKDILERICAGEGSMDDIPAMEKLFTILDEGSLCGLGKSAANPVRSTLVHFRDEYEAHIQQKKCPAGVCRALITYEISDTCTGCQACAKACPRSAITGEKKKIHSIDTARCDRCGICVATCKFDSIIVH